MTQYGPSCQREEIVSIIGGTGFVGRHVVAALARAGWRVRVISRRPDRAGFLQPCGGPGQIAFLRADIRRPASLAGVLEGSFAVVNAVGILTERGGQTFQAVHAAGAAAVAEAAAQAGVRRLVLISALGAGADSPARYGRSKAEGEARTLAAFPEAGILRPSIIVGPQDGFFNLFARMALFSPVLPLIGGGMRFQPVRVGDVAAAVLKLLEGPPPSGRIIEAGGPDVRTFRELLEFMLEAIGRRRLLLPVPMPAARIIAWPAQFLPGAPLTPDQLRLMERDNVVSETARREGRTLEGLGVRPGGVEAFVRQYLGRYRPGGQFAPLRRTAAWLAGRPRG